MIIGVPTEIKPQEYRVAVVPAGVEQLRRSGHTVLVQKAAGSIRDLRTKIIRLLAPILWRRPMKSGSRQI